MRMSSKRAPTRSGRSAAIGIWALAVIGAASGAQAAPRRGDRVEEESLRTLVSRTWREADGTLTAEITRTPVNYYDASGRLVPVELNLAPITVQPAPFRMAERMTGTDGALRVLSPDVVQDGVSDVWALGNVTNALRTYFEAQNARVRADGLSASVTFGVTSLRYRDGAQSEVLEAAGRAEPRADGQTVSYEGLFPSADVYFDVREYAVSKRVVFAAAPRPPSANLNPRTAVLSVGERMWLSRGAQLLDANGDAVTTAGARRGPLQIKVPGTQDTIWVESPFAFDAAAQQGRTPEPAPGTFLVELPGDGSIVLWSEIPYSWLSDPARRFPVTVDPTLTLQPDPTVGKDSQNYSGSPNSNFGTRQWLTDNFGAVTTAGIIEFNLTSIPMGSTVNTATLSLYHEFNNDTGGQWGLYANTAAWNEATVTWNTAPAFNPAPVATWLPGAPNTTDVINVQSSVQAMVNSPATNFGWRFTRLVLPGPGNWCYYRSSDDATAATRPKLEVNYGGTPPCGGGGPGSLDIEPDAAVGKDSQIYSGSPGSNFGTRQWITDNFGAVSTAGIIEFDLTPIPAGATITSATLSLWHEFNGDTTQWGLYRNLAAWNEATVTWTNAPAFNPVPDATFVPGPTGVYTTINAQAAVQAIVNAGSNFGWRVTRTVLPGPGNWAYFRSSDVNPAGTRPRLQVAWTAGGGGGSGTITCPPNQVANNAPNQCGANVNYPPATATDCNGAPLVTTCNPAAGAFFPVGTTPVTCTAPGNLSCQFNVTVNDVQPPTLNGVPADATVECNLVPPPPNVTATDNCDGARPVTYGESRTNGNCDDNYTLRRTWSASDTRNNVANAVQILTVRDTTPPDVTPGADPLACLWPPNHSYRCFSRDDLTVTAVDNCSPVVTWQIAGCSSSQPDNGNGDGNTINDCVVSPDGLGFMARSERDGREHAGRFYTVSVKARDRCNNESDASPAGVVHVPHSSGDGCLRPDCGR